MSDPTPNATATAAEVEGAPLSFESALAALERIVHDLEEGQIGLSEAMVRYERGVGLLAQCQEMLDKAERRIEMLTGVDGGGGPQTEPCDDSQVDAEQKQQGRRLRRTQPPGTPGSGAAQTRAARDNSAQSDVDEPPFAL
ncbi:MAG: exodeoxyribonuclease VII small subunit [Pirellulales bacterium]